MGFGGSSGGSGSLSGSSDVALSSLANSQVLTYDTAVSKWKNQTLTLPTGNNTSVDLLDACGIFYASVAKRNAAVVRIVFVGSSTTAGTGSSAAQYRYVNQLGVAIQARYPLITGTHPTTVGLATAYSTRASYTSGIQIINAGVGGTTSANYIGATELSQIAELQPAMIVHMIGTNDFRNKISVATYKANHQARIDALKTAMAGYPCVHLLVQPYEAWDTANPVAPWSAYGDAKREIAAASPNDTAYMDVSKPYYLVGVPSTDPLDIITSDNLHQNDAGHTLMADLIRMKLGV